LRLFVGLSVASSINLRLGGESQETIRRHGNASSMFAVAALVLY
jgi:hypothetical protein